MSAQAPAGEREILVTRVIAAPRALVWAAWTDPAHLAQWWGPEGYDNKPCALDLRVGGALRTEIVAPDGVTHPCSGVFEEIVPQEKLVLRGPPEGHPCGAGIPPNALLTVSFADEAGGTRVTLLTQHASAAGRTGAIEAGFEIGWDMTLARLAKHLNAG